MTSQDHENMNYEPRKVLKKAHECKSEDFNELLKEIEAAIEKSENDEKLLRAKKAITARIASRND